MISNTPSSSANAGMPVRHIYKDMWSFVRKEDLLKQRRCLACSELISKSHAEVPKKTKRIARKKTHELMGPTRSERFPAAKVQGQISKMLREESWKANRSPQSQETPQRRLLGITGVSLLSERLPSPLLKEENKESSDYMAQQDAVSQDLQTNFFRKHIGSLKTSGGMDTLEKKESSGTTSDLTKWATKSYSDILTGTVYESPLKARIWLYDPQDGFSPQCSLHSKPGLTKDAETCNNCYDEYQQLLTLELENPSTGNKD